MENTEWTRRGLLRVLAGTGLATGVGGCDSLGGGSVPAECETSLSTGIATAENHRTDYVGEVKELQQEGS
jgi:hypothetical protein